MPGKPPGPVVMHRRAKNCQAGSLAAVQVHRGSIEPLQFFGEASMTELSPGRKHAFQAFITALLST